MLPEAVQLLIYGTLMGAVGAVWQVLNAKITKMEAKMAAMQVIINNLQTKNGDLEEENRWVTYERDSYRRLYAWFRDAYRNLGGKDNPPPMDDEIAPPKPKQVTA